MDPLIGPDEGVTVAETRALFKKLRAALVPLAAKITAQPIADDSCLRKNYPEAPQLAFAIKVAQDFGYDLDEEGQPLGDDEPPRSAAREDSDRDREPQAA